MKTISIEEVIKQLPSQLTKSDLFEMLKGLHNAGFADDIFAKEFGEIEAANFIRSARYRCQPNYFRLMDFLRRQQVRLNEVDHGCEFQTKIEFDMGKDGKVVPRVLVVTVSKEGYDTKLYDNMALLEDEETNFDFISMEFDDKSMDEIIEMIKRQLDNELAMAVEHPLDEMH